MHHSKDVEGIKGVMDGSESNIMVHTEFAISDLGPF